MQGVYYYNSIVTDIMAERNTQSLILQEIGREVSMRKRMVVHDPKT